jgi:hypothetical protein
VYCTSHQSNFFVASWYRAPCSAKENLNFRSRLALEALAASRSAAPLNRVLALRSSLITLAQRLAASEGSLITAASQFLIVIPRLEFPANTTKQTLPAISNRYKLRLLQLGVTCTSRFAAVPSGLQPLIPRLQHPWPPCGGRLIANLELEFPVNPIRITKLQFSNRKFLAILSFPTRATNRELQATEFLIENPRLNSDLSGNDSNRLRISNRERIGVSRSAALTRSSSSVVPSSNLQTSNLEPHTSPSHSRHMHRHPFASRFSAVLCFVRFEEESE